MPVLKGKMAGLGEKRNYILSWKVEPLYIGRRIEQSTVFSA